jgi:hypothetical protein
VKDDGLSMDERILRQALRLESDEMPPRLDAALLASAARAQSARSDVLPLAIAAVAVGWVLSQLTGAALAIAVTAVGPGGLALVIDALTVAARVLGPATAIAAGVSFPFFVGIAALIVLAIAQRRAQHA